MNQTLEGREVAWGMIVEEHGTLPPAKGIMGGYSAFPEDIAAEAANRSPSALDQATWDSLSERDQALFQCKQYKLKCGRNNLKSYTWTTYRQMVKHRIKWEAGAMHDAISKAAQVMTPAFATTR